MRGQLVTLTAALALVALTGYAPTAAPPAVAVSVGPSLQSIGPLSFNTDGTMFAADTQAATIFALDVSAQTGAPGTADVVNLDQKIGAMLGTDAKDIAITDLAVHPKTHNAFVSVMRGRGPNARPALVRVDGAGRLSLVATDALPYTTVALPNPPAASPENGRSARSQSITDMAFTNGRLYVAGLSNEEFASKLWSVGYPFTKADSGASVEIYHGNHQRLETRAPIYAFIPYTLDKEPYIIASYTCTPLVKFPVASLKPGEKVRGTTIGEFGAGNRPLDMILYRKGGKEFLLMTNTSRGVMKVPTDRFAAAEPIMAPVTGETGGVPYEKVPAMAGVQQLDLLDATHAIVIAGAGSLNLTAVELP